MASEKNSEQDLGEQTRIRREKLAELQEAGLDPFRMTRFDWDSTSAQIRAHFGTMEKKSVRIAGRLMSRRGMGWARSVFLMYRTGTGGFRSTPAGMR